MIIQKWTGAVVREAKFHVDTTEEQTRDTNSSDDIEEEEEEEEDDWNWIFSEYREAA